MRHDFRLLQNMDEQDGQDRSRSAIFRSILLILYIHVADNPDDFIPRVAARTTGSMSFRPILSASLHA